MPPPAYDRGADRTQRRNLAERAAHWSAKHRRVAIFGWLALVLVSVFMGSAVGTTHIATQDQGNGESRRADQMLADAGFYDRASEQVLIQSRDGRLTVSDPRFRAAVTDITGRLARFDTISDLKSPLDPRNAGQISRDRRSALVVFDILGDSDTAEKRVGPILDAVAQLQRAHPQLRIEEFGAASADKALTKAFNDDFRKAELLSLPITLLILVVAFGALMAAGIPLLLGLSSVFITLGLLAPISQLWPVDEAISSVILLIGLAVGVDYSLFYLRRERDERAAGRGKEAALDLAAATSGRAVLVSGCTVIVAMAGMYITGNVTFQSFATGTILVVAVAVAGSLTVLPALLAALGDRVEKGRIPFLHRLRHHRAETGMWATIVDRVLRHPWIAAIGATAVLLVLAIPALHLHTANSGVQGLPRGLPVMQTYDRIQTAFPGGPLPALVVIRASDVRDLRVTAAIRDLRNAAVRTGLMQDPVTVTNSRDRTVAQVAIPLKGNGTDDTSNRALQVLRDQLIPQTVGRVPGAEVAVTGLTASSHDFNQQMKSRAPWVFAFVLALAFVLLMVTFRSIVIPIKAIMLNLLSVAAAYGVLVWVFQDGHLESVFGFTSIGGITSWLPLFLFVVLFGLSMDYHVFILSRVREGHDRGMATDDAVAHGIKATAGVVTSAAVVMVAVFAIFATLSSLDFKEMGVGLSTAVLIDATIVRAVLLPATMKLLGDWNWYLPRWLRWLPQIGEPAKIGQPGSAASHVGAGDLDVRVDRDDGRVSLVLDGELDLVTAPRLHEQMVVVEEDAATLIVDLRAVTFMDSTGIRELVEGDSRARDAQRRFVVIRADGTPVAHVLSTTALDARLETASGP
ncbi:MAG: anti-sigma-factor antagonist, partial [Solirubrobacterales bacterium]|nr:anti-sigma-factor antagonist [Solirubrobacterales bacterium]